MTDIKNNRNHYVLEIFALGRKETAERPFYSRYFDGTQAQAIKHFQKDDTAKKYMKDLDNYAVVMRANSVRLGYQT